MRLAQLLFKPKWQDKDAAVRRAAVAAGNDADLIEALPRLVREDPDAGVRLAALKRLNDYENWRERSTGDADKTVRDSARGAYLALLCAGGNAPTLQRRVAELDTLSADEVERVASTAANRDLRAAALALVTRSGVLAERAIADSEPQLRLAALERVVEANLLERIAERARKTDKIISRCARERLKAARISSGDAAAISAKARALCERVESLMRRPDAASAAQLSAIDAEWNALGSAIPVDITARYRGAHALVLKGRDLLENPPVAALADAVVDQAPVLPPAPLPEIQSQPALAEAMASRARFEAALAAVEADARVERERRKSVLHELGQRLEEFGAAIDSGDLAHAHRLHARIDADLKSLGDVPAALQRQLAPLQSRHAEMKRWQHWSNNQRRKALCADIETLVGTGLHPDALATRVREAREEWQRMDIAEGIADHDDASQGISRRFHAICQQALRPTRVYFSKRNEVRKSREEEIASLLARAEATGDDSADWKAIATLRTEASTALRSLDGVDPRARTTLAKRLKDVIARLSALTTEHEREVEASRQRLIEQAAALAGRGEQVSAPREVRDLQKRWTAIGNGRRATDQRQWREFRAACDAVFGKLDEARKERDTQAAAARTLSQQIVEEFEKLAADENESADIVKATLRDLDARWQAAAVDDRVFTQRQREARDAVTRRLKDAARGQRLVRYVDAMRKYTLLRLRETGATPALGQWDALGAAPAEFDAPLQARYLQAQSGVIEAVESETAREILIQLEFLAGIDSPAEDSQQRMNHQVQRLSSRLRGGAAAAPERELDEVLAAWFAQTPQPLELEHRFERAAKAAIDALP